MKKFHYILMLAFCIGILTACGNSDVKVEIPAYLFSGDDFESIKEDAVEDGVKDVEDNGDTYTFIMDKEYHKELVSDLKEEYINQLERIEGDTVTDVTYNDSLTKITFSVDEEELGNTEDIEDDLKEIGLGSMLYQLFNETKIKKAKVTFILKDSESGDKIDKFKYDLNDIKEIVE